MKKLNFALCLSLITSTTVFAGTPFNYQWFQVSFTKIYNVQVVKLPDGSGYTTVTGYGTAQSSAGTSTKDIFILIPRAYEWCDAPIYQAWSALKLQKATTPSNVSANNTFTFASASTQGTLDNQPAQLTINIAAASVPQCQLNWDRQSY